MAPAKYEALPADAVSPLFEMALEATEEAVYNSLLRATTVQSQAGAGGGDPGGAGARDPEEVRRGEVAATSARCRGDTRPGTPRCRA